MCALLSLLGWCSTHMPIACRLSWDCQVASTWLYGQVSPLIGLGSLLMAPVAIDEI